MKKFLCLLCSLAAMLIVAAPGAFGASAEKVLTIGVDQEVVGLDPNIVTSFSSHRRIDLLYSRLVRLGGTMVPVPDLAESWEIPDNLTYIFHLRRGVKFHNGREMKAEDVRYSLSRVLDPKTASPGSSFISTIKTIDVVDPYTVKITLSSPLASLLEGLASNNCSIVPREVVEQNGNLQKVAVGTGPFMLKEWIPDNSMTLVRNPDYFETGRPYIDKIIFRIIPEQASLLAGLKSGELDMATINEGSIITQAAKDPNLVVMQKPGLNVRTFGFNTTRKPFDDMRVREALALAIDRSEIVAAAEFGMGQPTGPIPVASTAWALPLSMLPYSAPDIARAKTLLAQAGYPNGFTFKIVTSSTYEGGLSVAQVIQDQLRKINVKAELEVVEWGVYIDRWVKRDFDSMVELRGGSIDPDRFLYRTLYSTGGVNNFLFKDADVDKLLDQGRTLTGLTQRKPVYDKLQALLSEKAPVIFLYCPYETQVMRPNVKDFVQMGNGSLYYLAQARIAQ